jgi:xanthine dehydrogenase accessory factor
MVLVLIKGAGDIASGVAYRLYGAGFKIVMTELEQPTMVRRTVSFGEAVYDGSKEIEGVIARKAESISDMDSIWAKKEIPILVDPNGDAVKSLNPDVIVDAIIAKKNTGTYKGQAPITIGLGPGFVAGIDVDAVVETMRGHYLGRVIYEGSAIPDTGIPGEIGGESKRRLLKSPGSGIFNGLREIGEYVKEGEIVAEVNGLKVKAEISGILRGLIKTGVYVKTNMKVGDIDPRADKDYCYTISDKARAVAGGVLEAIIAGCQVKLNKQK